jgi:hypothetical protein
MATALTQPRQMVSNEIRLTATPQTIAFKYIEGREVHSTFPGGRAMFTATDGRKLFLNGDNASELEHGLLDAEVRAGEPCNVSRVQHTRGGGFSIRVERITPEPAPPASAHSWQGNAPAVVPGGWTSSNQTQANTPAPPPVELPEMPNAMAEAFFAAIDAIRHAQEYARKSGAGLTFSEESVRAAAISIYIQNAKGGR